MKRTLEVVLEAGIGVVLLAVVLLFIVFGFDDPEQEDRHIFG